MNAKGTRWGKERALCHPIRPLSPLLRSPRPAPPSLSWFNPSMGITSVTDSTDITTYTLIVSPEAAGQRLDRWLAEQLPQFTRAYLQARIDAAAVTVSGTLRKASYRLVGGETVVVSVPPAVAVTALVPEPMPLAIIYEDADVIVLDKPPGLVVHPGAGNLHRHARAWHPRARPGGAHERRDAPRHRPSAR